MRQYEAAWEELRKKGSVRVSVHPLLHKRLIRAVMKERTQDIIFKAVLKAEHKKARIEYSRNGSIVTFRLIKYFDKEYI